MYILKELIEKGEYNKMFMAVNAFGEQVRKVAREDKVYLEKSGFKFDLHTIIGGQLNDDEEHKLFLLYPEGNWVELGYGAPFVIIGNSGHGKAILNRILDEDTSMGTALKTGFLSFDSTRVSSNNVDFPIDVVLYKKDQFVLAENRYEKKDLEDVSELWATELKAALNNIPVHACFKAYLGNKWVLFDATRLIPLNCIVKIATGRAAADTAISSIFGNIEGRQITVTCKYWMINLSHFFIIMKNFRGFLTNKSNLNIF